MEEEELSALRTAALASLSAKVEPVSTRGDEEELNALRKAALMTRKQKQIQVIQRQNESLPRPAIPLRIPMMPRLKNIPPPPLLVPSSLHSLSIPPPLIFPRPMIVRPPVSIWTTNNLISLTPNHLAAPRQTNYHPHVHARPPMRVPRLPMHRIPPRFIMTSKAQPDAVKLTTTLKVVDSTETIEQKIPDKFSRYDPDSSSEEDEDHAAAKKKDGDVSDAESVVSKKSDSSVSDTNEILDTSAGVDKVKQVDSREDIEETEQVKVESDPGTPLQDEQPSDDNISIIGDNDDDDILAAIDDFLEDRPEKTEPKTMIPKKSDVKEKLKQNRKPIVFDTTDTPKQMLAKKGGNDEIVSASSKTVKVNKESEVKKMELPSKSQVKTSAIETPIPSRKKVSTVQKSNDTSKAWKRSRIGAPVSEVAVDREYGIPVVSKTKVPSPRRKRRDSDLDSVGTSDLSFLSSDEFKEASEQKPPQRKRPRTRSVSDEMERRRNERMKREQRFLPEDKISKQGGSPSPKRHQGSVRHVECEPSRRQETSPSPKRIQAPAYRVESQPRRKQETPPSPKRRQAPVRRVESQPRRKQETPPSPKRRQAPVRRVESEFRRNQEPVRQVESELRKQETSPSPRRRQGLVGELENEQRTNQGTSVGPNRHQGAVQQVGSDLRKKLESRGIKKRKRVTQLVSTQSDIEQKSRLDRKTDIKRGIISLKPKSSNSRSAQNSCEAKDTKIVVTASVHTGVRAVQRSETRRDERDTAVKCIARKELPKDRSSLLSVKKENRSKFSPIVPPSNPRVVVSPTVRPKSDDRVLLQKSISSQESTQRMGSIPKKSRSSSDENSRSEISDESDEVVFHEEEIFSFLDQDVADYDDVLGDITDEVEVAPKVRRKSSNQASKGMKYHRAEASSSQRTSAEPIKLKESSARGKSRTEAKTEQDVKVPVHQRLGRQLHFDVDVHNSPALDIERSSGIKRRIFVSKSPSPFREMEDSNKVRTVKDRHRLDSTLIKPEKPTPLLAKCNVKTHSSKKVSVKRISKNTFKSPNRESVLEKKIQRIKQQNGKILKRQKEIQMEKEKFG